MHRSMGLVGVGSRASCNRKLTRDSIGSSRAHWRCRRLCGARGRVSGSKAKLLAEGTSSLGHLRLWDRRSKAHSPVIFRRSSPSRLERSRTSCRRSRPLTPATIWSNLEVEPRTSICWTFRRCKSASWLRGRLGTSRHWGPNSGRRLSRTGPGDWTTTANPWRWKMEVALDICKKMN